MAHQVSSAKFDFSQSRRTTVPWMYERKNVGFRGFGKIGLTFWRFAKSPVIMDMGLMESKYKLVD